MNSRNETTASPIGRIGRLVKRSALVAAIGLLATTLAQPNVAHAANRWDEPIQLSALAAPMFVDTHAKCVRTKGGVTGGSAVSWDVSLNGNWNTGDRFRIRVSDRTGKMLSQLIVPLDFSTGKFACQSFSAGPDGWINLTYTGLKPLKTIPIIGVGTSRDLFPSDRTVVEGQRIGPGGQAGFYAMPIPLPGIEGKERKIASWDCFKAWATGTTAWVSKQGLRILANYSGIGGYFATAVSAIVEKQAPLYTPDNGVIPTFQWLVTYQNIDAATSLISELEKLRKEGKVLSVELASKTSVRFQTVSSLNGKVQKSLKVYGVATDLAQAIGEAQGIYQGASFACGGK